MNLSEEFAHLLPQMTTKEGLVQVGPLDGMSSLLLTECRNRKAFTTFRWFVGKTGSDIEILDQYIRAVRAYRGTDETAVIQYAADGTFKVLQWLHRLSPMHAVWTFTLGSHRWEIEHQYARRLLWMAGIRDIYTSIPSRGDDIEERMVRTGWVVLPEPDEWGGYRCRLQMIEAPQTQYLGVE